MKQPELLMNPPNLRQPLAANPLKRPQTILLAALLLAGLLQPPGAPAQPLTLVLSNKWTLAPGSRYYLPTSGGYPRGLAINRVTGNVLIPSVQGGSNHVEVVSGADGSDLGSLSTGGAGSGILTGGDVAPPFQVGVADDGVIYACNLATGASGNFKLFRWSAEDLTGTVVPTVAFGPATPGTVNSRIGDSFCVRGAGTNTQIIASGTGTTNFTVFTTIDGTNFTANQIRIPATPGSGGFNRTVAFDGTNNAFWGGKPNDTKLYYVTFDLGALTATTVSNITFSPAMGMCAVRTTNTVTILAGIQDNGTVVSASRNLLVYDMSSLSSPAVGGTVAFPAGGSADGNITGQSDIGAGMVVALSTQGGVVALQISLQASAPATIATPPVGASGVYPSYTLSVGAGGTQPLHYQWLASNAQTNTASTFTNIPGAITNVYTITYPATNYFEVIVTNAYGSVTSTPVLVSLLTPVTSTVVTQLWKIPAGANGYPYLSATDNNTRGIGYDTNSHRVVVSSISGGTAIYILDGTTGTNIGVLDLTGAALSGGTFALDQVVIADDGAVYSGNLALAGQTFNLNRWAAPITNATAYNCFSLTFGNASLAASGDRWGDTMTVRRAGADTQILLGSRAGTNVALLTTSDGSNFVSSIIAITNAPAGFAANGIAFGAGNTLWAKAVVGHLYEVAFDPVGLTGGVLFDYPNPSKIPSYMVGVGVDPVNDILAGITLTDTPHDLQLYQLTGTEDAPVLFHQAFFASANANGNANVAIAMKYPRLYALDVNNGLLAVTYGQPPTTPPTITTPPASQTVYTNDPAVIFSAGVSGSLPLYYQWQYSATTNADSFTNIPGATLGIYTLSYPPLSAAGYYQVIVRNIAGYATSAPPALLTVITPTVSQVVTQLWTLAAGSRSYLDGTTYNTRGLAYDTNTDTVLVCDHQNIYILAATNGSDLFQLSTVGLPTVGYAGWTINQIAVADDGAVYSCNLGGTVAGTYYPFDIISWSAVSTFATLNYAYGGATGADPGNNSGERWGDTLTARGAGLSTELLIGSNNGTNVVLFGTPDGVTFTNALIAVTNAPAGFAGQGIAFGAGNTFWAKSPAYNLRLVAYDLATGSGGVVQSYAAGTQIESSLGGISVDVTNSILAGVSFNDTPNDMQLYLLSGNSNAPALFDQAFFGSNNANSQQNSVTTLKAGKGFGLDVNNGLVAVTYGVPPTPPTTLIKVTFQPGVGATIIFQTFKDRRYQVQYKNALSDLSWTDIGSAITGSDTTASYTDTTATGATTRFYRIQSL